MMVPTRQVTIPTSAGRSVRFASGIATINDTRDLPYLFARGDCKVMVTEYAMSWMPEVLSQTRRIVADVHWPDGWQVAQADDGVFDIITPELLQDDDRPVDTVGPPAETPPGEPESAEPGSTGDPLDSVLKGKPPWRKPRDN
jgi:hypothetical protein